jgi:hypothetical protein
MYPKHRGRYRESDRTMMAALITTQSSGVTKALQELITLGRTLKKRAAEVLAYFDRPGTSNGPTEAIHGRLEHLRGPAFGSATSPTTSLHPYWRPADSNSITLDRDEPLASSALWLLPRSDMAIDQRLSPSPCGAVSNPPPHYGIGRQGRSGLVYNPDLDQSAQSGTPSPRPKRGREVAIRKILTYLNFVTNPDLLNVRTALMRDNA